MEENKGYTLSFLEEVEDIKIISKPWDEEKSQTRPSQKADDDVQAIINKTYKTQKKTPCSLPSGVPTGRGQP